MPYYRVIKNIFRVGVDAIDIGLPTFGMHSIREWAGAKDGVQLAAVLKRYLNSEL